MFSNRIRIAWLALASLASWATPSSAQSLGVFSWQLQPYCNRVSVNVVQNGAVYTLDGFDDQCGAGQRVPVSGTATPNPDGTVEFGLNLVAANGVSVGVTARIDLGSFSGPWTDSQGASGTFAFGAATGGNARPLPVRVPAHTHSAPAGAFSIALGQSALSRAESTSSWNTGIGFEALRDVSAGGFNTAIGGSAAVSTTGGFANVAVGAEALRQNLTGTENVAIGRSALKTNESGTENVGVGHQALLNSKNSFNTAIGAHSARSTTSGLANTAVGAEALIGNTTGSNNVAIGDSAIRTTATTGNNTAIGHHAGYNFTTGGGNLFLGSFAGRDLVSGGNNIYLAHLGANSESNTTRIGTPGTQTRAFVAGVSGATSAGGVGVFINAQGQLGTTTSSRRFKDDIATLDDDVLAKLQRLRPVSFVYRPEFDGGARVTQYGLIAEEVDEVLPGLVVKNDDGSVQTVRYHFLTPLLLAEVQRLERERVAQAERVRALEQSVQSLLEAVARR